MPQRSRQFNRLNSAQNNAILLRGHLTAAMSDRRRIALLLLFPRNLSIDRVAQQSEFDCDAQSSYFPLGEITVVFKLADHQQHDLIRSKMSV
jgi:hypothetical protein